MFRRTAVLGAVALVAFAGTATAQSEAIKRYRTGPRVGVTWLGGALPDTIRSKYKYDVTRVITQFGWQYERQFASLEGGPVALNEFILLVGGLDQGVAMPSLTWLIGIRNGEFELGVGPNATPAGVALAVSVGQTFYSGALAIPFNVAYVPGKFGHRLSVLTGFNISK